jgi:hypothetical protein
MSDSNVKSTEVLVPLVEFTWGTIGPHVAKYALRYDEDVALGDGRVFVSCPEGSVDDWMNQGGSEDSPLALSVSILKPPAVTLCRPFPHAPVTATLYEADATDVAGTLRAVFSGIVSKSTQNSSGQRGMAKLQLSGPRLRFRYPLGIVANTSCTWTFADGGTGRPGNCGIDPATVTHALTLVGKKVVSGVALANRPDFGTLPAGKAWAYGSVSYDGLGIPIVQDPSDGSLVLLSAYPPEWDGQVVSVVEGCDKKLTTCRNVYHNEGRFGGFGYAMPSYQPMLENPF